MESVVNVLLVNKEPQMELHVRSVPLALPEEIVVQETKHANHGRIDASLGSTLWMGSVENVLRVNKELETDLLVRSAPLVLLEEIVAQKMKHANHGKMFARLLNTL